MGLGNLRWVKLSVKGWITRAGCLAVLCQKGQIIESTKSIVADGCESWGNPSQNASAVFSLSLFPSERCNTRRYMRLAIGLDARRIQNNRNRRASLKSGPKCSIIDTKRIRAQDNSSSATQGKAK